MKAHESQFQNLSAKAEAQIEVDRLLTSSRPQVEAASGWFMLSVTGLVLIFITAPVTSTAGGWVRSPLVLLVTTMVFLWTAWTARTAARKLLNESTTIEKVDEWLQLRQWSMATESVVKMLSIPMRRPERRMQALMQLSTLLQRAHRFEDAVKLSDYLLNPPAYEPVPEAATAHVIKISRAMALLRMDLLVDADAAIADLRRDLRAASTDSPMESAGLGLVELYRDAKTGHPREAIQVFQTHQRLFREQLGHRLADALILVALAYNAIGEADQAAMFYANATALVPGSELHRRFPETDLLQKLYSATKYPVDYVQ